MAVKNYLVFDFMYIVVILCSQLFKPGLALFNVFFFFLIILTYEASKALTHVFGINHFITVLKAIWVCLFVCF